MEKSQKESEIVLEGTKEGEGKTLAKAEDIKTDSCCHEEKSHSKSGCCSSKEEKSG